MDQSFDMIRLADGKDWLAESRPEVHIGDLTTFKSCAKYGVVKMKLTEMGYLTSKDALLAGFTPVRDHLASGGMFFADNC